MSNINIILVRHGNTFNQGEQPYYVGAKSDLDLTEQGQAQGGQLALLLSKHFQFSYIFTGQQKRHKQTASYFQAISGATITELNCFSEIDYGDWEGKTVEDIQAKWPEAYQNWVQSNIWPSACFRGNKAIIIDQLQNWFNQVKKLKSNTDLVVVTSQGILKLIYELISPENQDLDFTKHKVKTGHFCLISIKNDSVNIDAWGQSPKHTAFP